MFNKITSELLSYVYQNYADEAIAILKSGDFDKHILQNAGYGLPLYKITKCNSIILEDNKWKENAMPTIIRNRKNCSKLMSFWQSEYGYNMSEPMDFANYKEICGHFRDFDIEELLEGTLDELVLKGYNRDEAEFCYSVLVYEPELLQKHFSLRTNPDVYISGDFTPQSAPLFPHDCYNALKFSYETYCAATDIYGIFDLYESKQVKSIGHLEIETLLQAATYYELYNKLLQFSKSNTTSSL